VGRSHGIRSLVEIMSEQAGGPTAKVRRRYAGWYIYESCVETVEFICVRWKNTAEICGDSLL
jgi:hypothetical protein